eukprot:RCo030873
MSKAKVEGNMMEAAEDSSSDEDEDGSLEVAENPSAASPVGPPPASTSTQPSSSPAPARPLDPDSEDDEETSKTARPSSALAGISLRPKSGRSGQGLVISQKKKDKGEIPLTTPGYGDQVWGEATNDPQPGADVPLTTFSKGSHKQKAPKGK